MPARVNKETFETAIMEAHKLIVSEFYSDSCVPCKRLAPVLADIEETYSEQIKVIKVNINYDPELAEIYKVMASPTILFFQNGKETERIRGAVTKESILQAIHKHINI